MNMERGIQWPITLFTLVFAAYSCFSLDLTITNGEAVNGVLLEDESEIIKSHDRCSPAQNNKYRSCACMVERTKSYVNLNGIIRNCTHEPGGCKVPRFAVPGADKWDYAFQPCISFGMFQKVNHSRPGDKSCSNAAATRYTTESASICNSLGSQSEFQFVVQQPKNKKLVVSNLTLIFKNPDTLSSAVISLICNYSVPANESIFTFHGIDNNPSPQYYLALESVCCCPGGCNVTFPIHNKNHDPTTGFWAMIGIVAAIILFMIIAMIIVKCTKCGKTNEERRRLLDPNYS